MKNYELFRIFAKLNESEDTKMKIRHTLLLIFTAVVPLSLQAQKITLGTYKMKDGGEYKGEMQAGKPHGKGRTIWKDGDTYGKRVEA